MFVSYSALLVCVIIIVVSMSMIHKMGYEEGMEESYDMGYEACKKDLNFDDKLKLEFEEFLYKKGLLLDKTMTNIKTVKPIKKQATNK